MDRGLDAYIRLPESISNSRLALLAPLRPIDMLRGHPIRLIWDAMNPRSNIQFSPGVMKPSPQWAFGSAASFGAPGSGGSLGFADPAAGVGYAWVTSQMGTALTGDPRDVALGEALYAALPACSRASARG